MLLNTANCLSEIQKANWTVEMAAQALCFSGCWFDLTLFAQELGDTRIALLASVIASKTKPTR